MWTDIPEKTGRQELRETDRPSFFLKETEISEALTFDEVVEWEEGKPKLKKARAERLEQELSEIDDALQYALTARANGMYACKRCEDEIIYLNKEEIWKYGVTRKGEGGRYPESFLSDKKLKLIVQFRGTLADCLKQEKLKIYQYPLLPENLARPDGTRQPCPPGNLRTD